tara:strand:+ start:337 stop:492 length:156 start_codon:yes stop_codon:yes gene_type:complete
MSGTVILILVLMVTFLIGRYAIQEGQRIESHNKFIENMNKFDDMKKNKNRK